MPMNVVVEAAPSTRRKLGPLSNVARRGKLKFFLPLVPKDARILDVGCADNWFRQEAEDRGWTNITGVDLTPPADIVGDIFKWRELGMEAHSFDAIVAFEVIEHGDFAPVFHDLLKPGGLLLMTTPVPRLDPVCQLLEHLRLLQQRSSPHTHLTDLRRLPSFDVVERRIKAGVSQWGVLRPEMSEEWAAPAVQRIDPDRTLPERDQLEDWLDIHRQTLRRKCAGLRADQLKERAVPPSALTLLGLVRHMTDVERWWFRMHAAGEKVELIFKDDHLTDDFDAVDEADAAADLADFDREVALAKAAAADVDLDKVVASLWPGSDQRMSVRWIFLHMIEEYARHNGHADLLRERIDGATGD